MGIYSNLTRMATTHAEALLASSERDMDSTTIRETIQHAIQLVDTASKLEEIIVDRAHELGLSWSDIGNEYGITKQAAHQRFG